MIGAVPRSINGLNDDVREILHEHEVPPRGGHKASLTLLQPMKEDRQRAADVARADHIRQAERDEIQTGNGEVILWRGLGDRVARIGRVLRVIEADWLLQRPQSVTESRLEIDEPADAVPLR